MNARWQKRTVKKFPIAFIPRSGLKPDGFACCISLTCCIEIVSFKSKQNAINKNMQTWRHSVRTQHRFRTTFPRPSLFEKCIAKWKLCHSYLIDQYKALQTLPYRNPSMSVFSRVSTSHSDSQAQPCVVVNPSF